MTFLGGYVLEILLYGALLLAQSGTTGKQFAMKKCGRIAPGPFNSVCINMARSLICLLVSVVIWLATGGGATTFAGHLIIIISGIGTAFNLFTWILSSRMVSLSLIECLMMVGSLVVPLILAPYLYDGDTVSFIQWVGCALIFASVFLFIDGGKKGEKKEGSALSKILVVTVCAIGIMVASVFKKYYTYHITAKGLGSIEYFTLINFVTVLSVFLILFVIYYSMERKKTAALCTADERPRVEFPYKRAGLYIIIAAVSLYVAELFTSYAAQLPSAIYYPLTRGLAMGCTFLLDVIVFKDKVTVKKITGLITIVLAIVLVNL